MDILHKKKLKRKTKNETQHHISNDGKVLWYYFVNEILCRITGKKKTVTI